MRVLVLNAGSSSLKASVLASRGRETLARAEVRWGSDATATPDREAGMRELLGELAKGGVESASLGAVGHRIVHGGARFVAPVQIDDAILAAIEALRELAPLHNGIAAETIRAGRRAFPSLPQVASFDTAFHATLPEEARTYPVPLAWRRDFGVRRYGFHGLSVDWASERAGELLGRPATELRLVVAHLGSGCSVTAVLGGRSVHTSMGMTPLEGLMMGTRAGSIDPGILLALLRDGRVTLPELGDALDHRSGLLGVSGSTADMRRLLGDEAAGDERATLAVGMFVRRAAAEIAAAATALPALDALVFTGGIGEHSDVVRARIAERLAVLAIPALPGGAVTEDAILAGGPVAVLRVEAREDVVIARQVEAALGG